MNSAAIKVKDVPLEPSALLSHESKGRLLSRRGEPLFFAAWERVLFIHFEVDTSDLQRDVPFRLDLRDGKACVSLVAFTMRNMRFRFGGWALGLLLKPIATHSFLNLRTYVEHRGERGIYFLTEWLSNWLSVRLGPLLYGLPYRYAWVNYRHAHEENHLSGEVKSRNSGWRFTYQAELPEGGKFAPCPEGSPDEFLLERYTAFTSHGPARRFFRIWHPPWPQTAADISIQDDSLLTNTWPWFGGARLIGANFSRGFNEVWMGRAHRVR